MITTLHIKNIGIISDLTIDFHNGFNVLTGETGAGKSLMIDSLSIIAGGRFSKEMIRNGENHSFVEACVYYPESENAVDGNIIVSREIYANGRNLCKINGRMCTVNELKEFMRNIIDIHGQNDNQTLFDTSYHIKYLDSYIGEELKKIKNNYEQKYIEYQKIKEELKKNYGDDREKQRKLDLLKYQLEEITVAKLKETEEDELEEKRKRILNSEKIVKNLTIVDNVLSENAIDSINESIRALEKIEDYDTRYQEKLTELKNVYYEVQEISRDISEYVSDVNFDEEDRNSIEERLDTIHSLKRKYGNTIKEILNYKEDLEKQIDEIENLDERNKLAKKKLKILEERNARYSKQNA